MEEVRTLEGARTLEDTRTLDKARTLQDARTLECVRTLEGAIVKRLSQGRPDGVAVIAEGVASAMDPNEPLLADTPKDEHGNVIRWGLQACAGIWRDSYWVYDFDDEERERHITWKECRTYMQRALSFPRVSTSNFSTTIRISRIS